MPNRRSSRKVLPIVAHFEKITRALTNGHRRSVLVRLHLACFLACLKIVIHRPAGAYEGPLYEEYGKQSCMVTICYHGGMVALFHHAGTWLSAQEQPQPQIGHQFGGRREGVSKERCHRTGNRGVPVKQMPKVVPTQCGLSGPGVRRQSQTGTSPRGKFAE